MPSLSAPLGTAAGVMVSPAGLLSLTIYTHTNKLILDDAPTTTARTTFSFLVTAKQKP